MKKLFLIPVAAFAIAAAACSSGGRGDGSTTAVAVKTVKANYSETGADREYVGVVESDMSASLSFPVVGTVEKIFVVEGQRVGKGALLARLDSYSLTNAHAAAQAMLKQAEDAMARMQMLYDNESLAEIRYIEMQTDLEKARAMEAIARRNLEDSRLVAPFAGVIGRRTVEAGENVLPNQSVLTLLKVDGVKVKVAVPENEINSMTPGQAASIAISAMGDEVFSGKVTEKGVAADPLSHTYNIRVAVDNPGGRVLPGMVCNVTLSGGAGEGSASCTGERALVIPNRCVQRGTDGGVFVWIVSDGRAAKRNVQAGRQTSDGVEILGGLNPGDEIVSDGYQKITGGAKVEVL